MPGSENRRQYTRQSQSAAVKFTLVGSDEFQDGVLINLGEGGLCIEAPFTIRTGTLIYVQILDIHPESQGWCTHKSFKGRIKWSKDLGDREQTRYSMGLEFIRSVAQKDL